MLQSGGLKERVLAAHRAGIKKVLIPTENKEDWVGIPYAIRKSINIVAVESIDEVLKHALTKELKPIKWAEIDQSSNKDKTETTSTH